MFRFPHVHSGPADAWIAIVEVDSVILHDWVRSSGIRHFDRERGWVWARLRRHDSSA